MLIVYVMTAISALIGAFIAVDDLKDSFRSEKTEPKDCSNGCK